MFVDPHNKVLWESEHLRKTAGSADINFVLLFTLFMLCDAFKQINLVSGILLRLFCSGSYSVYISEAQFIWADFSLLYISLTVFSHTKIPLLPSHKQIIPNLPFIPFPKWSQTHSRPYIHMCLSQPFSYVHFICKPIRTLMAQKKSMVQKEKDGWKERGQKERGESERERASWKKRLGFHKTRRPAAQSMASFCRFKTAPAYISSRLLISDLQRRLNIIVSLLTSADSGWVLCVYVCVCVCVCVSLKVYTDSLCVNITHYYWQHLINQEGNPNPPEQMVTAAEITPKQFYLPQTLQHLTTVILTHTHTHTPHKC